MRKRSGPIGATLVPIGPPWCDEFHWEFSGESCRACESCTEFMDENGSENCPVFVYEFQIESHAATGVADRVPA